MQLNMGSYFQITASEHGGEGVSCLQSELKEPLGAGKSADLQLVATFTQLQKPFPAAIWQNEPQRMLYLDTVHVLSPYKVNKQITKVSGRKMWKYLFWYSACASPLQCQQATHKGKQKYTSKDALSWYSACAIPIQSQQANHKGK